jgi:hypothetical protein
VATNPEETAKAVFSALKAVSESQKMWTQLAAEVAALKIVVSQISPETRKSLEEQLAIANDKFREVSDSQRTIAELMRSGVPKKSPEN